MLKMSFNRSLSTIAVLSVIVFWFVIVYFSQGKQSEPKSDKINVIASFYPLSYATKLVGGDLVSVRDLVPAGVEPHDFEPSARDLIEIGKADALIYNGASLEPWVGKWEDSSPTKPKRVVDIATSLTEREVPLIKKTGAVDPHFWLDPTIMKSEVLIIRDVLADIDPLHQDKFSENAARALALLDALDQEFLTGLSSCTLRDIIVLHEAFEYVGRRYGILVNSIKGISPDEEPSPKVLGHIVDLAREKGIRHIFFETVSSPKFSKLIAREIGGTTLVLNPVESLTPNEVQLDEDYISLMKMNLSNLQTALLCK